MNPINPNTVLKGELAELHPLEEKHFEQLSELAKDQRIWEHIAFDMSDKTKCLTAFSNALIERNNNTQFPFVIYHKQKQQIIGSTRLMNIEPANRKLEIGWTWLHPEYWATRINLECKLLLLSFCFEELKVIRVMIRTDENNHRSRKAIEKIGAQFEGILRKEWIRDNGTFRNSVYFSIIDSEWNKVKANLNRLLTQKTPLISPKPVIQFDNFTARELKTEDAQTFCDYVLRNKFRIASSAPNTVREVYDTESAVQFIQKRINAIFRKECIAFTLFNNQDNKPVANLIIKNIDPSIPKGEIGYNIDWEYEGKGITTRFVNEVCNYAFNQLGFNKLYMRIRSENIKSRRIAEKNNFVQVGVLQKDYLIDDGQLADVIYYEKIKQQ